MPHNIRFDNTSLQRAANDLISSRRAGRSLIRESTIHPFRSLRLPSSWAMRPSRWATPRQITRWLCSSAWTLQPFLFPRAAGCGGGPSSCCFPIISSRCTPDRERRWMGPIHLEQHYGSVEALQGQLIRAVDRCEGFSAVFPGSGSPVQFAKSAHEQGNWRWTTSTKRCGTGSIWRNFRPLQTISIRFVRNIGTYDGPQFSTYQQGWATLIESLTIADQLANSTKLRGNDTGGGGGGGGFD